MARLIVSSMTAVTRQTRSSQAAAQRNSTSSASAPASTSPSTSVVLTPPPSSQPRTSSFQFFSPSAAPDFKSPPTMSQQSSGEPIADNTRSVNQGLAFVLGVAILENARRADPQKPRSLLLDGYFWMGDEQTPPMNACFK